MDMDLFAQRLKTERESKNISAEELAEAVGVNKATIHRYEKKEFKSIKSTVLDKIAVYLNVNPSYLKGESDERITLDNIEAFTKKEKKEIDDILNMTEELLHQDGLMFDGLPADEEAIRSIIDAMMLGLEIAKRRNKEKYTADKYKK